MLLGLAVALGEDSALPSMLAAQGVCCVWLLAIGLSSDADSNPVCWSVPVFLLSVLECVGGLLSVAIVLSQGPSQHWLSDIGNLLVDGRPRCALLFLPAYLVVLAYSARIGLQTVQASARYLWNDMPGLQMAIDGEMICGQLSAEDARRRRRLIERDTDFFIEISRYGKLLEGLPFLCVALTGLSFVGGVVSMHVRSGSSLSSCCDRLLVCVLGQATVLVLSTVMIAGILGLMTTARRYSPECPNLPRKGEVVSALRGLAIELISLLGLGLPPGTSLCVGLLWRERSFGGGSLGEAAGDPRRPPCSALPLVLEVGPGYRKLGRGWDALRTEVSKASRDVSNRLGCFLARPDIQQKANLPEYAYRILLGGRVVGQGQLWPTGLLVVGPEESISHLQGLSAAEPLTGQPALWWLPTGNVDEKATGCSYYEPLAVLSLELSDIMHRYAGRIVRDVDLDRLLEEHAPVASQESELLLEVCRLLLDDGIPLLDRALIGHTFAEGRQATGDPRLLAELVRVALGGAICGALLDATGQLNVIKVLALAPPERSVAGRAALLSQLAAHLTVLQSVGLPGVVVTEGDDRVFIADLIRDSFPGLRVLSWHEVPDAIAVDVLAEVTARANR
jgi:flagellar biosynthesis protein FlhA